MTQRTDCAVLERLDLSELESDLLVEAAHEPLSESMATVQIVFLLRLASRSKASLDKARARVLLRMLLELRSSLLSAGTQVPSSLC